MINRRSSILASIDWATVSIFLILVVIGWVNIYSAGFSESHPSMFDLTQQYGKQALWIAFAIVLAIFTLSIDQRFFEAFSYIIYGVCMLLLLSVLAIGIEVKGAQSWIDFGFFRLQPAEIAKIGTALALSMWMSRHNFKMKKTRDFLIMGGILVLPMGLILLQNDTGSALTYTSFIILFYRRGLNRIYLWLIATAALIFIFVLSYSQTEVFIAILTLLLLTLAIRQMWTDLLIFASTAIILIGAWWAGNYFEYFTLDLNIVFYILAAGSSIFLLAKAVINKTTIHSTLSFLTMGSFIFAASINKMFTLMGAHQQDRIMALLGLKSDPFGVEYHVIQSLIAIGSGGFNGKGFLQGTQTKFNFVPEQTTDFIFSTIGEEFGFIGTAIVIALYLTLMLRLIFLAERQRSLFSKNYGYSLIGIIFIHFAINIGMVTGTGLVIGVPLPFLSYGGSSLWGFTLLLFIFLKMDARRMEVL